ncbi:MAG: lipooligosaccharide sialyltransferase [Lachnospiraceae bacterium]|nr:lipooligosaccharide sialyltransferase [Lachnospiraceae bacterium]
MKDRIYICHTYYHAYISFLKELALPKEKQGGATLMLSTMSNRFETFGERVKKTGLFEEVLMFEEKREDFFPELASYRQDRGSLVANLLQRIKFTKRYAELEAPYVPVDLKEYGDIYVFCDSDPIGYYLNQNKIRYHAVEDGLNCLVHYDAARYDNRGHFGLKAFLSEKCNLIFVQNGYGKYCLDMEVNDIAAITMPCKKYVELPRKQLTSRLTPEDVELLMKAFVRDPEFLEQKIAECNAGDGKKILILTDPVCDLDVREQIFRDIIAAYEKEGQIFLKPHPRDLLDYGEKFPEYPMFDASMPMEMLNFVPDLHFDKVVTVFTDLKGIEFADSCIRLGDSFMDKYEKAEKHGFNLRAGITPIEADDKLGA